MPIYAMTEEKLAKLPKWIQEHIKYLERKVQNLEESISNLTGEEESDIKCIFNMTGKEFFLPTRSTIRFSIGGLREYADVSVAREGDSKKLNLFTGDQAVILPEATNHFSVYSTNRIKF